MYIIILGLNIVTTLSAGVGPSGNCGVLTDFQTQGDALLAVGVSRWVGHMVDLPEFLADG